MINTEEIKENLEGIQLLYDIEGYISTNTADELIKYCRSLVAEVERLQIIEKAYNGMRLAK